MAFDFHEDRDKYFRLQASNSRESILPFIEKHTIIQPNFNVLEIGCRDGGVLLPFYERGCRIVGFDLESGPVKSARIRYKDAIDEGRAIFDIINVHDYIPLHLAEGREKFDIILLKDVIEHIEDQDKMIESLHSILKEDGVLFIGFPAWQSPFGGHQQVLTHKIVSKLPYIHILPRFLYFGIVKLFSKSGLSLMKATHDTRISIERFERLIQMERLKIQARDLYFVSPMHKHKFGLKPRLMWNWLAGIPYIRNLFATNCEYIIRKG